MKQKIILYMTTCIVALLVFNACSKNSSSSDEDTTLSLGTSAVMTDNVYDDAFDQVLTAGETSSINAVTVPPGSIGTSNAVMSVEPTMQTFGITLVPNDATTFPKTMTIDFGTGTTDTRGTTRSGQIVASLSGKITTKGSVISIAFNNYTVNGYKIEGSYSITNNSAVGSGLSFIIQITNGKITFPDSTSFAYACTDTLNQKSGAGTLTFADDIYSTTGNFTFSSSDGKSITGSITSPLIKQMSCKNIVSGIITLTYNKVKGTLDFGTGDCDNTATYTVGNKVETITLPR